MLSGVGEAIEPGRTLPISALSGVWVPSGHPHGLAAGAGGMLEVGFQSPPDPTAIPFEGRGVAPAARRLLTQSLPSAPSSGGASVEWAPVFTGREHWWYLDPHHATLASSQRILAVARAFELVVVVVRGAVELITPSSRRIGAVALLRIDPGTSVGLRALESPTLLLGIRARVSNS